MGQLETLPLPRLNGSYPFRNRAYAGPAWAERLLSVQKDQWLWAIVNQDF